jgi:hypothetical protein
VCAQRLLDGGGEGGAVFRVDELFEVGERAAERDVGFAADGGGIARPRDPIRCDVPRPDTDLRRFERKRHHLGIRKKRLLGDRLRRRGAGGLLGRHGLGIVHGLPLRSHRTVTFHLAFHRRAVNR